jgi:polyhydroxyalkanoate synthase subunit PhaC
MLSNGLAQQSSRLPANALVGHSIGGTFAAIFADAEPARIQKLLLLEAPLRFGAEAGSLALIVGSSSADVVAQLTGGAAGSLLDVESCAAALEEFIVGRWHDAGASLVEPEALSIHQRTAGRSTNSSNRGGSSRTLLSNYIAPTRSPAASSASRVDK